EVPTGNDRSGKQEHEHAAAETVSSTAPSPVRAESTGIPAALARAPVMAGTAESGGADLQGSSGSMPLASPKTAASALSVSRRLHPDISSGPRPPLAPGHGNRGISTISRVSEIVARQAAGMANSNRLGGAQIGIHAGRHVPPEAAKPQRFLSYQGKPLVQAARTRGEAHTGADIAPTGLQPERNVQVAAPGTQPGSTNDGTARPPVLARRPIPETFLSNEVQEIRTGEGNAGSIARTAVIPEGANAPGNQAVPGHTGSASDPIVLPHVFPASPPPLVQRQAVVQRFPRAGFTDAHHAGQLPLRSQADALATRSPREDARPGIARSRILEGGADPTAKNQGNRYGDAMQSHFPLRHAVPDTVWRAIDRAGKAGGMSGTAPAMANGGGKEGNFLARIPGPAFHALSASGTSGMGADPYPGQLSGPAGSRLLSGGISSGETIPARFMHPPGERSSTIGELRASGAALRRAAIVSPVSGSGSTAAPVHPPAADAREPWPASVPSSHGYQEVMQRSPDSVPVESPALSVPRTFAMQPQLWRRGRDRLESGLDEGEPASLSRTASSRADVERPLVLVPRIPQMQQMQRMEAGTQGGEAAVWGRIMRATDDADGGSAHSFPLARQESPEDRYGVVPAPFQSPRGAHGAPGGEVAAAESSAGKPDTDEMAAQTWRLISERLMIEQERRGLTSWHR
ncbi:MAG TPA: hypothetical protein VHB01_10915, partial [Nitrosospira sp.]|nr:hypothetical protein [Nitrosospira sp.]